MAKKETHYLLPVLEGRLLEGDVDAIKTKILDTPKDSLVNLITEICKVGNVRLIEIIISVANDANFGAWTVGIFWAARNGHKKVVELIVQDQKKQDEILQKGLSGALHGNHRDLVDFILETGSIDSTYWKYALYGACASGSRAMVDLVLSKGVDWFTEGLRGAYASGNKELIDLMIPLYEKQKQRCSCGHPVSYLEIGLIGACEGGQFDIVNFLMEFEGLKITHRIDRALSAACANGHRDIADVLSECGATNLNNGLYNACIGGYPELARLMIAKGATNVNAALLNACESGHVECARLMIENGADYDCLVVLIKYGHYDLAAMMINNADDRGRCERILHDVLNMYIPPDISLSQIAHLLNHGANIEIPFLTKRRETRQARVAEIIIEQTKGVSTYDEKNITDIITSYIGFETIKPGLTRKRKRKRNAQ